MKKSWILLVLAALLVVALAMPASASVTDPHCACGATTSGTTCASCGLPVYSDWKAWDLGNGKEIILPVNARYYLTSDLTLEGEILVPDNANVTIDLNGFDITAGSGRFTRYGIIDFYKNGSTATNAGSVTITDTSANKTGELLIPTQLGTQVGAVARVAGSGNTFNLVNASVRALNSIESTGSGMYISGNAGNTITVYNAKIDASNIKAGSGCAIALNGTLNIKGNKTVIKGGTATSCSAVIHGYGATINIYDGTIYGGTAPYGAITYLNGTNSTLKIEGGTLIGGTATGSGGGAICFQGTTMTMTGGTMKDGEYTTGANGGGNLCVFGGTVNISGGLITGGTSTAKGGNIYVNAGTVNISGSAKIQDGEATGTSVTQNAQTAAGGGNIAVNNGATLKIAGGEITGGKYTGTSNDVMGGGNIFLDNTSTFSMTAGLVSGGEAGKGGNIFTRSTNATMSGGTVQNGNATLGSSANHGGGNIYCMTANSVFTMSGGTIKNGTAVQTGGNVCVRWGTFNMTNGTISNVTDKVVAYEGGNVGLTYSQANFNMSGGTITGGKVTKGGAGIAALGQGGNIKISGTASITGGIAEYGAALMVNNTAAVANIEGGTINGGQVTGSCGGTLLAYHGTINVSGGTINGGTVPDNALYGGGTFAVIENATMNISGGTINAGTAKRGSCGYINGSGTLSITAGKVAGVSKFGGTLNVSGAPTVSIALSNNQSFSIPAAITKTIGISCDDWSDVIAVASSKAVADASKQYMGNWAGAMIVENGTNIRLQALLEYKNGSFVTAWAPAATLSGGAGVTYKMSYNITRTNLNDMAEGTVVDLNGFTLTLTNADLSKITLADSSAAGYTAGTGKIAASNVSKAPKRSGVDTATKYRYVTILQNGNYSAHRIYVAIKSTVLAPTGPSVNFRTVLKCDAVVAGLISQYGAQFTGTSTATSPSTKAIASGNANTNDWLTTLANASPENFGKVFTSYAFFKFTDNMGAATITSSSMTHSVQSMVEYASANLSTMNVYQTDALVNMYKKYSSYMTSWSIDALARKASGGVSTT